MSNDTSNSWGKARLISFRFLFCYLVFFNIPQAGSASIFDLLPWGNEPVNAWLAKPMQPVAIWLAVHLFHLHGIAITFHPTGSGDTALNYVLVFLCLCLAVIATIVWSVLDRRRMQYRTLETWLRLFVALVVGESMLEYGFAKIFPGQFGPISIVRLNETYGESSPMALLWTFMSGSRWYTMFGGLAEALPGVLLFFRRTRTLGALMAGGVLLNVVLLNFCYDVPVKIYSVHLLSMCLFLAWPDLAALARLFFLRGQVQLRTDHIPASERRWVNRTGYVLLGLMLVGALLSVGVGTYQPYPALTDSHIPFYGHWQIDHASATTQQTPWSDLYVDRANSILIKRVDGTYFRLNAQVDPTQHTIAITSKKFGDGSLHYTVDATDQHQVAIAGTFNKGAIQLHLTRHSPDQYSLLTRGFHWINEETPNW